MSVCVSLVQQFRLAGGSQTLTMVRKKVRLRVCEVEWRQVGGGELR